MGVKALRICWADSAERDLDSLLSFIALEDPEVARGLFIKVLAAIEHAAVFPEMARFIPKLGKRYRQILSVRPFRVIYRIVGKELRIIGVMRMEQDFQPERFLET